MHFPFAFYPPVYGHIFRRNLHQFVIYLNLFTLIFFSVGLATDHELDSPGSNPGGDEIFRASRPALRPTQAPVKWVQVLSRG